MNPEPEGVRVIPIGGVGEFGANATIVQSSETEILIDYGLMFPPDQRQPGVEYYINDPQLLTETFPRLSALFVTHAHEDHIGAVGFLLKHINIPVYTMPYTAHMLRRACEYFDLTPNIIETELNRPEWVADISVEFIGVTHSIVEACALAVKADQYTVIHTGDFKVDPLPPDNHFFQSDRLRELGEEGVDLLIMDSTNAGKSGFCPSDQTIVPYVEEQIRKAPGRVFFTTFSSHMPRIKKLKQIARRTGRRIAMVGRGFEKHFEISQDTRYMTRWPETFVSAKVADNLSDKEIIYVVTGSQAEQQSALARIGKDGFRGLRIKAGDHVIFSSKSIPGNERQIALLASDLERKGATVVTEKMSNVHTSGHGYREDLAYMLALTRPRAVAPIHGEFMQLFSHYHWLKDLISDHQDVLLIEDGDVVCILNERVTTNGCVETCLLPIDGARNMPIDHGTLKDRKNMMYSGLVMICADIKGPFRENHYQFSHNGVVINGLDNVEDILQSALAPLHYDETGNLQSWADVIFRTCRRALKRVLGIQPLIKVIINGDIIR